MKSLSITRIGHAEFTQSQAPSPAADEVLLDVKCVGLCGSDLNTFRGANPLAVLPRIPGHEISGTIVATGQDVPTSFGVGKSVVVIPYTTCGTCSSCKSGRVNACKHNKTLGVQQDGGMCEQIAVRHDRLILNESLSLPHMALVEPLSVGFHAAARGRITAQDIVVVIGGGMIGVGAILGARARGARVIAVEVSETKHAALRALGAEMVLNPITHNLADCLNDLTDGHGPSVTIEAVGLPETFRAAVDLVGFSGRVVYVGYAKTEVSYDTTLFNLKELDIMGSRNATRADFEAVIEFLEHTPHIADSLISRVFSWAEAEQAFDYWDANRNETFKIMIDFR